MVINRLHSQTLMLASARTSGGEHMADEKTRVEQYRDPTRQAQVVRGHPDILHNADWQNRIDDLNDQAAKLVKQMTRNEREGPGSGICRRRHGGRDAWMIRKSRVEHTAIDKAQRTPAKTEPPPA